MAHFRPNEKMIKKLILQESIDESIPVKDAFDKINELIDILNDRIVDSVIIYPSSFEVSNIFEFAKQNKEKNDR